MKKILKEKYNVKNPNKSIDANVATILEYYKDTSRRSHVQSVASMVLDNVKFFNNMPDLKNLNRAIVLHDITKSWSTKEHLSLLGLKEKDRKKYAIREGELHALTGSIVAEKVFGINDTILLDAIKHHTSTSPNMSVTGKLLYVYDNIDHTNHDRLDPNLSSTLENLSANLSISNKERNLKILDSMLFLIINDDVYRRLKNKKSIPPSMIETRNILLYGMMLSSLN